MAPRSVPGLPTGTDLDALFRVLRTEAFTREVDDAHHSPRDGLGIDGDWITVDIGVEGTDVRATTRQLRPDRAGALADAEALLDAIVAAGQWTAYQGGWIGIHPAREYADYEAKDEVAGWFGAVSVTLISAPGVPA